MPLRKKDKKVLRMFLIRSYNVGDGPVQAKLLDLERFAGRKQVSPVGMVPCVFIILQEMMDREDLVMLFLERQPDWDVIWRKVGPNAGHETPILYNKVYASAISWFVLLIKVGFLGPKGKGKSIVPYKSLNNCKFRFKPARRFVRVLNHHLVVSALTTRGPEHDRRVAAWINGATRFFNAALRSGCVVIGGGDWNLERTTAYMKQVKPADWVWDSTGPTIKAMTYDNIGHIRDNRIHRVASGVDETDGSRRIHDHKSPWVVYGMRTR